jgi:phage terminase small subunit
MSKPRRPQTRPLTERQCLFVTEYLVDFNARQAAIRAGYPPASAANRGWELLHECPPVMQRVEAALIERERRTLIEADRVLKEIARIAFADIRHYVTGGPEELMVRPLAQLSDDDAAAVAEIRGAGQTEGPRSIKLHDKRAALELLARHLGLVGKRRDSQPGLRAGDPDVGDARALLRERLMRYVAATDATEETEPAPGLPVQ